MWAICYDRRMLRVAPEQLELEPVGRTRGSTRRDERSSEQRATARQSIGTSSQSQQGIKRRAAADLLTTAGALLTRSHLRELGLERRAVDAVFRALPVVALPGYSRPMIRAEHYLELVEQHTYRDDRVRPARA
jgi:hypothetical protein